MGQILLGRPHLEEVIATGTKPLVMASGGLDSGYVLYQLSTKTTGKIAIHHCDIGSTQEVPQRAALLGQIKYLGADRFEVHRSALSGAVMTDFWLTVMLSVSVAKKLECGVLVTGDDLIARTLGRGGLEDLRAIIVQQGLDLCIGSSVADLAAAYAELPADFAKHTWSCATPIVDGNVYRRCGGCQQCVTHKKFNLWDRFNNTQPAPAIAME